MGLINKNLQESQILLVLLPKSDYNDKITEISKEFTNICNKVCYISMSRPYRTIISSFKEGGVPLNKLFFIDTISKCSSDKGLESMKNCFYISSPSAFSELAIAYSKVLKSNFGGMIFDSVSTLNLYSKGNISLQLLHSLINKAREKNSKVVIIASEEDKKLEIIKNLYLFVDDVVEVEN